MKFIIIFLFFISINSMMGQNRGSLHLEKNKLTGACDHPHFTGFTIELDSIYTELDSSMLFAQLPRIGTINFKNRVDIPTEFTLSNRAGDAQIMFRFRTTYLTFDSLQFHKQLLSFQIDSDPKVPVTEKDLRIIRLTQKLLAEEKYWNKEDDRNCEDDLANKSYSIYCALRIASLEIENKYNHRNAALQKLRQVIQEKYPNKKWSHRLMDFNNMEEVAYPDIVKLLKEIELAFIQELRKKE